MANEFKLSYTGSEINEKLGMIDKLSEEIADKTIPMVFIDGDIPTNKNNVLAEMRYVSDKEKFHAFIKIKYQGSSSLNYDKKNFTVSLFEDEERENKLKKVFKHWGTASNKFVLKANYIDHSHARNIVSARLWSEMVKSRPNYDTLPTEMRSSPNNGAIDGFPIKLYYNGTYQGLYTWNIGKDDWLWNMDDNNPNHILLGCCYNDNGVFNEVAGNFRALWDGVSENYWEVEVGEESDAVTASLNRLISCVKDTSDEEFKASIGNYLDLQSAIDYYLYFWVNAGLDSLENNLLLATYDGVKWICGAYDMDSVWGLHYGGYMFISPEFVCPDEYQGPYSLLWERIRTLYKDEIKERYNSLRQNVLSYANITSHFDAFCGAIGKDVYEDDIVAYPSIPSADTNNIWQLRNYVRVRLFYVDSLMNPYVPKGYAVYISGNNFINDNVNADGTSIFQDNIGKQINAIGFSGTITSGNDGNGNIVLGYNNAKTKLFIPDVSGMLTTENGFTIVFNGSIYDLSQTGKYMLQLNMSSGNLSVLFGYTASSFELYGISDSFRPKTVITLGDTADHTIVYTTENSRIKGYLDGEKIFDVDGVTIPKSSTTSLYIGGSENSNEIKAKLGNLMLYNRALSDTEISLLSKALQ